MRPVFLLAIAVAIATDLFAQTSSTSGTVISYTPSKTDACDTMMTTTIQMDALHYDTSASFFKTYCDWLGRVLVSASDGGYYMGGETP